MEDSFHKTYLVRDIYKIRDLVLVLERAFEEELCHHSVQNWQEAGVAGREWGRKSIRKQAVCDPLAITKALGFILSKVMLGTLRRVMNLILLSLWGHKKSCISHLGKTFWLDMANEICVGVICYFWAKAVKMSYRIQPISSSPAHSNWLSYNNPLSWIPGHTIDMLYEWEPLRGLPLGCMGYISVV